MFSNYRMFKDSFEQNCFFTLLPNDCIIKLVKFRTTNNKLPVNRQRYSDVPRNERICDKCDLLEIGDEFHYIFTCPFFADIRQKCLTPYYYKRPNSIKYKHLFSTQRKPTLLKLCHLLTCINNNL